MELTGDIDGASDIIKLGHCAVANAIGVTITQVGGEYDQIVSLTEISRKKAIENATESAKNQATLAGADEKTLQVVDIDEVPLAYLPGNATRIMVKIIGDLCHESRIS